MRAAFAAWKDGWGRVRHAPAILALVVGVTLAAALPFGLAIRGELAAHLGSSEVSHSVAAGADYDWWQEFQAQATGLGATFTPRILGFAALLDSLSAIADARGQVTAVASLIVAYALLWTWLTGGIVDRLARQRAVHMHGFGAASHSYVGRLARLSLGAAVAYWWLFAYVHPWLFDERWTSLTSQMDAERTAFLWRVAAYALFGSCIIAVNLVADYARIRLIVEDRHSVWGAVMAALRFVRRNPADAVGLYLINASGFLVLVAVWALIATEPGASVWPSFLLAQLFITARLATKLHFLASQTALFQSRLAHARYTAASLPIRAVPAAVETMGRPEKPVGSTF